MLFRKITFAFSLLLIFFGLSSCRVSQSESSWQRFVKGLPPLEGADYYENLNDQGFLVWSDARNSDHGRILNIAEQSRLDACIKLMTFPISREEFWEKTGYHNYDFRPSGHSLTTGNIWETYWINENFKISLRTTYDERDNIEEIYDSATIVKMN